MLWYEKLYVGEKAKKHRFSIIRSIRIAEGYKEALELAGRIVGDMYEKTGTFCLEDFLKV